jgi:hypothetical protein
VPPAADARPAAPSVLTSHSIAARFPRTWDVQSARGTSYDWRYCVGFDVTAPVRQAIAKVPARTWTQAITPEGQVRPGAHVTEITGLLHVADGKHSRLVTLPVSG